MTPPDSVDPAASYPVTNVNKVKRVHDRGRYDKETIHAILDAALVCHIAYVIDGRPYCTPTGFWRGQSFDFGRFFGFGHGAQKRTIVLFCTKINRKHKPLRRSRVNQEQRPSASAEVLDPRSSRG